MRRALWVPGALMFAVVAVVLGISAIMPSGSNETGPQALRGAVSRNADLPNDACPSKALITGTPEYVEGAGEKSLGEAVTASTRLLDKSNAGGPPPAVAEFEDGSAKAVVSNAAGDPVAVISFQRQPESVWHIESVIECSPVAPVPDVEPVVESAK